jgi:hypothetical protein
MAHTPPLPVAHPNTLSFVNTVFRVTGLAQKKPVTEVFRAFTQ